VSNSEKKKQPNQATLAKVFALLSLQSAKHATRSASSRHSSKSRQQQRLESLLRHCWAQFRFNERQLGISTLDRCCRNRKCE